MVICCVQRKVINNMSIEKEKIKIASMFHKQDERIMYMMLKSNKYELTREPLFVEEGLVLMWRPFFALKVKKTGTQRSMPTYQVSFDDYREGMEVYYDSWVKDRTKVYVEKIIHWHREIRFFIYSYNWFPQEDGEMRFVESKELVATFYTPNQELRFFNSAKRGNMETIIKRRVRSKTYVDYDLSTDVDNPFEKTLVHLGQLHCPDDEAELVYFMFEFLKNAKPGFGKSVMVQMLEALKEDKRCI